MRAIKTTTISILAVGLLTGSAVGVAAQDEEAAEVSTPAYATWQSGDPTSVVEGAFDEATGEMRGLRVDGIPLESSDPRLTGTAYFLVNGNVESDGDTQVSVESRSTRIVNDEGAWTGVATYVEAADTSSGDYEPVLIQESSLLFGEGAYEGLMMVGFGDYLEANGQGEAVIFSVGSPPVAEIPEAPAE